jgi:hypothetical protein
MRKTLTTIALLLGVVGATVSADAQVPFAAARTANVPAATLLLPYFEVELPKKIGGKPKGIDTIFSITNVADTGNVAHVTIWSDLAVPVTNFEVYLTGYDTITISLFDVLNGHLPRTAGPATDPGNLISPNGSFSTELNFPNCGVLPYPDPLPTESIEHLRATLTGQPSSLFGGKCAGRSLGDKKPIARGYVTVDIVNSCNVLSPSDVGYFISGGLGIADNDNELVGDYAYVNKSKKIGRGDAMVHIRAANPDSETSLPGEYTFYSAFVFNSAADNRQPLATQFAGRFVNAPKHPVFPTGTSVIAWRDTKRKQQPFTCGTTPFPFPLTQQQIVVFDEQENPEIPQQPPIPPFPASDIVPFPAAAQITKVGGPGFPVATTSGWIFFNLSTTVAGVPEPAEDPAAAQATLTMVLENKGKYSASYRAITLDSATDRSTIVLPTGD